MGLHSHLTLLVEDTEKVGHRSNFNPGCCEEIQITDLFWTVANI